VKVETTGQRGLHGCIYDHWKWPKAETATKLSPAALQKHSLGGFTTDMPP